MAALYWMMAAMFLAAGYTADAVDQNLLTAIVNIVVREYGVQGMFSVAVRIPLDQNQRPNLAEVFNSNPGNKVKESMNNGQVYLSSRVIAAKRSINPVDHAESRVVDYLPNLVNAGTANNILLFYVYSSPCIDRCSNNTHRKSILQRITPITSFPDYAVVFTKIYIPNYGDHYTEAELRAGLERLGSKVGLRNVFRCDRQCRSCANCMQVSDYCVKS